MTGKFIVIEGADGSGKATQQKLLIKRIRKDFKKKVYKADFPRYEKSFFGHLAGRYLEGEFGSLEDTSPYLSSLTFAGDRWQAKENIVKHLSLGEIVISNRYALANMAHQSAKLPVAKRADFLKFLEKLEFGVYKIPREDINIFLEVPSEIGQKLVDKKEDRKYTKGKKRDIHEENLIYQKECLKMYKFLAKKYPERIRIINCCNDDGSLKTIEEIHQLVWDIVFYLL